ncbi:hypothetical protein [Desulfosarcina variabilis]|uniref:hypothetical protein n=1 Tax=Desulfosarcina variabilis TaxID=2300 RepID=UPI003AFB5FDF
MRKARFKKQLTIAIPLEHFELIKQATDEQEISIAEWVRDAMAQALLNHPERHQEL